MLGGEPEGEGCDGHNGSSALVCVLFASNWPTCKVVNRGVERRGSFGWMCGAPTSGCLSWRPCPWGAQAHHPVSCPLLERLLWMPALPLHTTSSELVGYVLQTICPWGFVQMARLHPKLTLDSCDDAAVVENADSALLYA